MTSMVLLSAVVMGILGVVFGFGLAVASRFFHVEVDERIEAVSDALPGANCGACGYAGCDAYAEAVVGGEQPDLCVPGQAGVAAAVAHVMGLEVSDTRQVVRAVVHCQGSPDVCERRYVYDGLEDCRAAHTIAGGPKVCDYGCLGFGTCVASCPFDAITMGDDDLPVFDWDRCTGCGACTRACPRSLIEVLPTHAPVVLACSNPEKGKKVVSVCKVGCISCMKCMKVSPEGAVRKVGTMPVLTYPEGESYEVAVEKCPKKCFLPITPPRVGKAVQVEAAREERAAS